MVDKVAGIGRKLGYLRLGGVHAQNLNMRRLLSTDAPAATILIRIAVGGIFLTEGIQKFLYPGELGAGRFAKIGIPAPDMVGHSSQESKSCVARS